MTWNEAFETYQRGGTTPKHQHHHHHRQQQTNAPTPKHTRFAVSDNGN